VIGCGSHTTRSSLARLKASRLKSLTSPQTPAKGLRAYLNQKENHHADHGTGLDLTTGTLLVSPIDAQAFGQGILHSLGQNVERIRGLTAATQIASSFRGEVERAHTTDLGNPREAGWTYLVNKNSRG